MGMVLGGVQETFLPQSGVVCDYDGMRTAAGAMTGVALSIGNGVDSARFAGVRASYAERGVFLTDLSAIGDEAFTLSTPAPGLVVITLIARRGDVLVTLSAQASLELLKVSAKIPMSDIPYKGTPQALQDLVGGQIDVFFVDPFAGMPVASTKRMPRDASASATGSDVPSASLTSSMAQSMG